MLRVKSQAKGRSIVIEVEVGCEQLNSNDGFVVVDKQTVYLWMGVGTSAEEQRVAEQLIK